MGRDDVYPVRTSKFTSEVDNRPWMSLLGIIPTHDMHQWLLLQIYVLLMMDAESVRNM